MTSSATVHDPVCHMDIDPANAAGTAEHEGVTYYFCSRGCKLDFEDNPQAALQAEAEFDHSQPVAHDMAMMDAAPTESKKPWWKFW